MAGREPEPDMRRPRSISIASPALMATRTESASRDRKNFAVISSARSSMTGFLREWRVRLPTRCPRSCRTRRTRAPTARSPHCALRRVRSRARRRRRGGAEGVGGGEDADGETAGAPRPLAAAPITPATRPSRQHGPPGFRDELTDERRVVHFFDRRLRLAPARLRGCVA